ncbi:hypothetical protein CSOJ01_14984 [Colletotrichum sojae]|uniref:Heterokaryon incompatibility domain-containing protein n=1 Tax=Colletotrichum sojae TaxID=2175907 RepID=A0A8H6INJ8_9PEZI|nr:hypothetical protein CSOJ01_14984 [Colletotrichum sojae]
MQPGRLTPREMETYRYGTVLPASALCSQCQKIPFDDKGLGGREEVSEDGLRSLHFGSATEALNLPIDWHIEDDWPSLTHLYQRLGDSYCPMCRWIKDALIHIRIGKQFDDFDAPGFVQASLAFRWNSFSGAQRPGLSALVMNLGFLSSDSNVLGAWPRFSGLQFTELTTSIQEAVKVTRALGLKYLWVDALCIIQRTGSDWDVQCAIMDQIYRNAHITICALGSASCRQGFFNKRPKITLPFHSRLRPDIVGSFAVDQPVVRDTEYCLDADSMDYDVAESNWDDRGWTFQEMVLSTRMLMFGKRSVHFSCSEFHETKQSRRWAGTYTDRTKTLTVGTDVLPAFAGTASLFQTLIGDQYLAGLWKGDLHRGLIWSRYEPADDQVLEEGLLNAQQYMGPSWSWARLAHLCDGVTFAVYQMGGYAVFSHTRCRPEFVLDDVSISASGANPFGRVLNGTLRLTTRLYRLTTAVSASQVDVAWDDESATQLRINGVKLADVKIDFESIQAEVASSGLGGEALKLSLVLIGSTLEEDIALHLVENDDECTDATRAAEVNGFQAESRSNSCATPKTGKGRGVDQSSLSLRDSQTHMLAPRFDAPNRPMTRRDRTAYSLVVYPTRDAGQFYRVGIFFSTPESGGGLGLFDSFPEGTISLV